MNMTCKHSQRLWKYLQRRYWWPQCKKFHRLLFWSDFIFKDSFGVLNINAKKFFKKFTVFHGQISVWIVKFPSKSAKFCEQNATAYGHRCKKSCNILTYKNSNRLKKNRNPVFFTWSNLGILSIIFPLTILGERRIYEPWLWQNITAYLCR